MKFLYALLGSTALIWALVSPESADMSTREAVERAIPRLHVLTSRTTRIPAALTASNTAYGLDPQFWEYETPTTRIHGRGRVRRLHGRSRRLRLPADFEQACLALQQAWSQAARELPTQRNLLAAAEAGNPAWDAAFERIQAAYEQVRAAAATHGVTLPRHWSAV